MLWYSKSWIYKQTKSKSTACFSHIGRLPLKVERTKVKVSELEELKVCVSEWEICVVPATGCLDGQEKC